MKRKLGNERLGKRYSVLNQQTFISLSQFLMTRLSTRNSGDNSNQTQSQSAVSLLTEGVIQGKRTLGEKTSTLSGSGLVTHWPHVSGERHSASLNLTNSWVMMTLIPPILEE